MPKPQDLLSDPSARTLIAGDLEAVFLPGHGMLGASLRHEGVELLGRVENLSAAAASGSTAGIPLLYPWANRLAGFSYQTAGRKVTLDPSSPLLHFDASGLPMHGVPWSLLVWELTEARQDFLAARLDWTRSDLLEVFPFHHRLEMATTLRSDRLSIETTLLAGPDGPVPVSFGFHPYFGLPNIPRAQWRLELPAMRKLVLDGRGLPTGEERPFGVRGTTGRKQLRRWLCIDEGTNYFLDRGSRVPDYGRTRRGLPIRAGLRAQGQGLYCVRADDRPDERAH